MGAEAPAGAARVAVVGAGAVGSYFGGMLARAGVPVVLVGRAAHVEAIARDGLLLEATTFRERVRIAASTDISAIRGAPVVLLCVKTPDTEGAARTVRAHIAPGAVLVSLQNGVDNVERIRSATGLSAVAAAVYVACAVPGPGRVTHAGRGDLVIGEMPGGAASGGDLPGIAAIFEHAGVHCRVTDDILGELWMKMVLNCAYNAISALGRARYERLARNAWTRALVRSVVLEVAAVAHAAGARLPAGDPETVTLKLADSMPDATSSTAQDIERGRPTEIDSLNGYVARRGEELGVAVPVNRTLHALVKLLEERAP